MNDNGLMMGADALAAMPGNPLVAVLEQALAQAKAGQIIGVVVVAVTPGGQLGMSAHINQAAHLVAGCEIVKGKILETMQAPASPIVRPGAIM